MMKRFNYLATALMTVCFAAGMTSCDNKNRNDGPEVQDDLFGTVTEDLTLEAGQTYYLSGSLQVKAPATLTIERGVRLVARNNGEVIYILIEQGAKINAQGTASEPIVMTSEREQAGAWGGLHICGYAHTNAGSTGMSEIGNAPYGGSNDNDNSGVLRYVRLEYTGYAFDSEHESNGISLYGVGRGTTISYVQTYMGSDDGIEFFGGSVNIDHAVVVDCTDDCFDWTEGWNGTGQYLVAYQSDPTCDCLMECDNNGDNFAATPVANPTISHVTLVGNNSSENVRGIRLRAGTYADLSDLLITGKTYTVNIETSETDASFASGISSIKDATITGSFRNQVEGHSYTEADFLAAGNNVVESISLTNRYVSTVAGLGAVDTTNDWTAGWTR